MTRLEKIRRDARDAAKAIREALAATKGGK